jgi:hypothetical protein
LAAHPIHSCKTVPFLSYFVLHLNMHVFDPHSSVTGKRLLFSGANEETEAPGILRFCSCEEQRQGSECSNFAPSSQVSQDRASRDHELSGQHVVQQTVDDG